MRNTLEKTPAFLLRCFYLVAGLAFCYVFSAALFWNRGSELPFLLVGVMVLVAGCMLAAQWLKRHDAAYTAFWADDRKRRWVVVGLLVLFMALQSYFAWQLMLDQSQEVQDIRAVRSAAAFVAEHPFSASEDIPDLAYFKRYENNQFILTLITLWFMLCRAIFPHGDYEVFGAVLNVLGTTGAMACTYLAAKNFLGVKKAFPVLLVWFCFLPFYVYAPTYYTDLLSVPFLAAALMWVSFLYQTKKLRFAALAGVTVGLGMMLKGTLAVLLVAILIWLLLANFQTVKKRLMSAALCLACVLVMATGFKVFYEKSGLFGQNPTDHNGMAYPVTHWMMMAQNGSGPYNIDDVYFSGTCPGNYKERRKVCWDIMVGRIIGRDLYTNLGFANRKVVQVWGDGTYQARQWRRPYSYYPDSPWNSRFDVGDEQHSAPWFRAMHIFHFTLLFAFVGTLLHRIWKKNSVADGVFLCQLALFGMFLFLLIWEWRSRYLLAYAVLLMVMLPVGICDWWEMGKSLLARWSRKKDFALTH